MANVLKVQGQEGITSLAVAGWSIRRIARALGVDRKTVRRYLRRPAPDPGAMAASKSPPISTPGVLEGEPAGRPSLCDAHAQWITGRVEAGLSAQRIFQDLVAERSFAGSYQSVKRFVRRLRAAEPSRVWRVEVQPGEEAQADFGSCARRSEIRVERAV